LNRAPENIRRQDLESIQRSQVVAFGEKLAGPALAQMLLALQDTPAQGLRSECQRLLEPGETAEILEQEGIGLFGGREIFLIEPSIGPCLDFFDRLSEFSQHCTIARIALGGRRVRVQGRRKIFDGKALPGVF